MIKFKYFQLRSNEIFACKHKFLSGCLDHKLFWMEISKIPYYKIFSISLKALKHTSHIPNTQ